MGWSTGALMYAAIVALLFLVGVFNEWRTIANGYAAGGWRDAGEWVFLLAVAALAWPATAYFWVAEWRREREKKRNRRDFSSYNYAPPVSKQGD